MPPGDNQLVTLPLLDRLTDLEPGLRSDSHITRAQSVRTLKASLRRDLEWLFNSKCNHELPPESVMPEVNRSVMNFGLPDFTNYSLATERDQYLLLRQIEHAIAVFEPRLMGVQVRMIERDEAFGKTVRFQITGLLKMDPSPEQVSFDTVLDIPSGEYAVKGESGAG